MKRIIAAIVVLVLAVTLSGCKEVPSFWDELTKAGAREYIQSALQNKYGEEFEVISMGIRSGQYYRELVGTCSPKSDENIVFNFEVNNFGGERELYDDYIQNIVRKQLKQVIDEVLSTYYDIFASEVFVTPLTSWYDSGIHSVDEATIKAFSESFSDQKKNETSVWIILTKEEKKYGIDKLKSVLYDMMPKFYSLNIYIDFFFADDETVGLCDEKTKNVSADHWAVKQIARKGNFPMEMFVIYNDERGLVYSGSELNY